ncbi:MAG: VWA domain-containing protein [Candidatus Omnitrophica bacterium]|nr:VWA domain-containing protein [Candidatus Omnitrophota bacterium]
MEFKNPIFLAFIPFVLAAIWYMYRRRQGEALGFSCVNLFGQVGATWKTRFGSAPFLLRALAGALLCIALAGPRQVLEESKVATEGIDIVLALDCSGSMAAEDFKIDGRRANRLEIIKKVVAEFISRRKSDQLALVGFAGRAYTICPLTTDRGWLLANLERIRLGMMEDGTAIGSGIASSLSRFKKAQAKSKIIVLLTDGVNNTGTIDPLTAARTAAAMGVKIYTIGAGTRGFAPFPARDLFGRAFYQNVQSDLDEDTLKETARITGGQYFRAVDTESLRGIYQEIDRLEKTKIEQTGYRQYQELFGVWVVAALIVLAFELGLANTVFLKIP